MDGQNSNKDFSKDVLPQIITEEQAKSQHQLPPPKEINISRIILFLLTILLVICGYGGYVFYREETKISMLTFEKFLKQTDYTLDSNYVRLATSDWTKSNYQNTTIAHPKGWKIKEFDIGQGPIFSISKHNEQNEKLDGASILIGDLSVNSYVTSCKEFAEKSINQAQDLHKATGSQTEQSEQLLRIAWQPKVNDMSIRFIPSTATVMGFYFKTLDFCFEKDGKEYFGTYKEYGPGEELKYGKDFILLLNSLEFL